MRSLKIVEESKESDEDDNFPVNVCSDSITQKLGYAVIFPEYFSLHGKLMPKLSMSSDESVSTIDGKKKRKRKGSSSSQGSDISNRSAPMATPMHLKFLLIKGESMFIKESRV